MTNITAVVSVLVSSLLVMLKGPHVQAYCYNNKIY